MARNLSLYPATLPLTEQEETARQQFIDSFTRDYNITSESDKILLQLASVEYIKGIRLQLHELETGKPILAARQHPLSTLDRLLNSLDATRAARLRGRKTTGNSEEDELRAYFLSLSAPTNNGKGKVSANDRAAK